MTVKQLIKKLSKYKDNMPVYIHVNESYVVPLNKHGVVLHNLAMHTDVDLELGRYVADSGGVTDAFAFKAITLEGDGQFD